MTLCLNYTIWFNETLPVATYLNKTILFAALYSAISSCLYKSPLLTNKKDECKTRTDTLMQCTFQCLAYCFKIILNQIFMPKDVKDYDQVETYNTLESRTDFLSIKEVAC